MGLEFYDLSHPWGLGQPCWPYFEDVKIERIHYMAKSGVLSQRITTVMHSGTHIDAPGHVVQGTPFIDEVPLPHFFGSGIVVSIPKKNGSVITADDLEKARQDPAAGDIVIVNTGWHKYYGDSRSTTATRPGFYKEAGEWFVKKKVKMIGTDTQANDHPLGTAIGPHGPGWPNGCSRSSAEDYKKRTGRPTTAGRLPGMGAGATARSCRPASAASRTSAATSTRSPASASPSRGSRGAGTKRRRLHRAPGRDARPLGQVPDRDGTELTCSSSARRRPSLPGAEPLRHALAAPAGV
jgi:kynurenine formamidase